MVKWFDTLVIMYIALIINNIKKYMEIYDEYKPVVLIIMPTYNWASYLKRSIESVFEAVL